MRVIGVAVTLFFGAYEQVGNTVALWLETGVDRRCGAVAIPMTWFQAGNPIFVFARTPFLIARWRRRAEAGHDGPAIGKMAIGSARVGDSYVRLAKIGRGHVWTRVTNGHLVCRILLEKKKNN